MSSAPFEYLSAPKKLLTPIITPEGVAKAQTKQMLLSPAAQQKVREFMKKYPGPITMHFDAITGELKDIEKGKI
jgi:hypothetical protein